MASETAPKVPVYSQNDLKSTTDDALAPYLTTLPKPYTFKEDHFKTNVRFVVGYAAVAIAAFTFYADRRLHWEATRSPWVLAAVGSYFVLNTIFTYWIWGVEGSEIFRGRRATGEVISISSDVERNSPIYTLNIQYKAVSGAILEEKEIEKPFTDWFSADGTFHPEPLRKWLAKEINILSLAAQETEVKTGGVASVVGVLGVESKDKGKGAKGTTKRK
ncbi:signal peptidase complex subunit 2 [Aspergillus stella-maris]|uniref:signal peptidase complex subunit 2 n=1 Tax=Aspergillus stella-maris TaxID=1810926 RepID=UPI003CCD34E3